MRTYSNHKIIRIRLQKQIQTFIAKLLIKLQFNPKDFLKNQLIKYFQKHKMKSNKSKINKNHQI